MHEPTPSFAKRRAAGDGPFEHNDVSGWIRRPEELDEVARHRQGPRAREDEFAVLVGVHLVDEEECSRRRPSSSSTSRRGPTTPLRIMPIRRRHSTLRGKRVAVLDPVDVGLGALDLERAGRDVPSSSRALDLERESGRARIAVVDSRRMLPPWISAKDRRGKEPGGRAVALPRRANRQLETRRRPGEEREARACSGRGPGPRPVGRADGDPDPVARRERVRDRFERRL